MYYNNRRRSFFNKNKGDIMEPLISNLSTQYKTLEQEWKSIPKGFKHFPSSPKNYQKHSNFVLN